METEREKTFDCRSAWDKLNDKLEDELDDYQTQEAGAIKMQEESDITFESKSVWEKIKDKLDDELDEYNTREVYKLIKDKLFLPVDVNMDITHPRQILENLENNYFEKECIEILRHVFHFMHLHVVSEGKNFNEVINEYEKQLPGDEQIHDVMKILVENKYKGIWLCGMGGMGKTTLAEEICYRLQYNLNYRFFNLDMKGKSSLVDLNQEILIAQNLIWREYGDLLNGLEPQATSSKESVLNLQVLQSLRSFSYESVLLLDNMDDLQRKDGKKLSLYLTDVLSEISKLGEKCKNVSNIYYMKCGKSTENDVELSRVPCTLDTREPCHKRSNTFI